MDFIPNVGLPPLYFGMDRNDIQQVVGPPEREDGQVSYHGVVAVSYDDANSVEAFSVKWDPGSAEAAFNGHRLFQVPAEEMVQILSAQAAPTWEDGGRAATFFDLGLQLWRPEVPGQGGGEPDPAARGGQYWMIATLGRPGFLESNQ